MGRNKNNLYLGFIFLGFIALTYLFIIGLSIHDAIVYRDFFALIFVIAVPLYGGLRIRGWIKKHQTHQTHQPYSIEANTDRSSNR